MWSLRLKKGCFLLAKAGLATGKKYGYYYMLCTSSSGSIFLRPSFTGNPLPKSFEEMSAPYSTITSSSMLLTSRQNSFSTSSVGTIYTRKTRDDRLQTHYNHNLLEHNTQVNWTKLMKKQKTLSIFSWKDCSLSCSDWGWGKAKDDLDEKYNENQKNHKKHNKLELLSSVSWFPAKKDKDDPGHNEEKGNKKSGLNFNSFRKLFWWRFFKVQ